MPANLGPGFTNPESFPLLLVLTLFFLRNARFLFLFDLPPFPPDVPEFGAGEGFELAELAPSVFIAWEGDIIDCFLEMLILLLRWYKS